MTTHTYISRQPIIILSRRYFQLCNFYIPTYFAQFYFYRVLSSYRELIGHKHLLLYCIYIFQNTNFHNRHSNHKFLQLIAIPSSKPTIVTQPNLNVFSPLGSRFPVSGGFLHPGTSNRFAYSCPLTTSLQFGLISNKTCTVCAS